MPVKLEFVITEGWKKEENKRSGPVAVALFKDSVSGSTLFQFAPTLEDCDRLEKFFTRVRELDGHNKKIYALMQIVKEESEMTVKEVCH